MTRAVRLTIPRAAPLAAPYELPFEACSIYVENPSGVWYDVAGFTVPPWTWGLVNRLDVAARAIAIAQRTPAGLVSENYGGDLLVIVYAGALMPATGRSLYPAPHRLEQRMVELTATEVGLRFPLGIAAAGERIVPLRATCHAAVSATGRQDIRGLVEVSWLYDDGGVTVFADQAVSPEQVHAPQVELGHTIVPAGVDVEVDVLSQAGIGRQRVALILDYYRAMP